jgi:hypothetical protein
MKAPVTTYIEIAGHAQEASSIGGGEIIDGVFIDRGSKDPHDIVASGGKRLAKLWMRTPRAGVGAHQHEQLRQSALWNIFSGRNTVR